MRNNFYSFSDAFREANRKQKIEYFTSEQEQAQLTATRRQFRSFLIALDIEYGLLKDPEEKSKFIVLPLEKPCNIRRFRLSNPQTVCTFPCFFPYGLKQGKDFYSPLTTLSSSRAELRFASLVEWA